MIVAVDEARAIGKKNGLLWHIPEDLKHFKELTVGHTIIMGKNTYHSIGRALPNRNNIVLTGDAHFTAPGCFIAHSIDEALQIAQEHESEEIFVIGGANVYQQFLPKISRLYLTLVKGKYEADTFFPEYSEFQKVLSEEAHDNGTNQFTFFVLER